MAIVWIKEIHNYHPTGKLKLTINDDGRIPRLDGKDVKEITANAKETKTPENLAVPWSYLGKNSLSIEVEIDGRTSIVYAEIRNRSGWDYILFRDKESRESGEVDAGSLGDAPSINHSWWAITLHSDGQLQWHVIERQGLKHDEALAFGRFALEFSKEVIDIGVKVVGLIVAA